MNMNDIDKRIQELDKRRQELKAENEAIEKSQEELWKKIESHQGEYAELRTKARNNLFEMVDLENQRGKIESKIEN